MRAKVCAEEQTGLVSTAPMIPSPRSAVPLRTSRRSGSESIGSGQ